MATLISRGDEIRFTILPYPRSMPPIQQELIAHPSDYVLGYITYNEENGNRKFTYTESGKLTVVKDHWSLAIMKELPYVEQSGPWIVYNCSPEKSKLAFLKLLPDENLLIHNWDTWSVKCKDAKVAVITSWEIY